MSQPGLDEQVERAAQIVADSSYLIALVGAGMSKESGIPTFRGGDGLWDKHGEPPMDGYQRFLADPAAWWAERLSQQQQGGELAQAIEEARSDCPPEIAAQAAFRQQTLRAPLQGLLHGLVGSGRVGKKGPRQGTEPGRLAQQGFQLRGIG